MAFGKERRVACALVASVAAFVAFDRAHAQSDTLPITREVRDRTLASPAAPAVDVTIADPFRYVGASRLILSGVADAELHMFVKAARDSSVDAFYWLQFEHFLPDNQRSYEIGSNKTIDVDGLSFYYDTLGYSDFHSIQSSQTGSDGAAAVGILASRRLSFPRGVARVRLFHFPDAQRRSELMIIYGESLPASVTATAPRFQLDGDTSAAVVEHMKRGLTIRKR